MWVREQQGGRLSEVHDLSFRRLKGGGILYRIEIDGILVRQVVKDVVSIYSRFTNLLVPENQIDPVVEHL